MLTTPAAAIIYKLGQIRAVAELLVPETDRRLPWSGGLLCLGLSGGITHDALIAAAAVKGKAKRLCTLNPIGFERVIDGDRPRIYRP